ncbi:MAG: hypothetical protein CVU39_11215 [Chloroflexi bacterium HGW-Chloroflexi-10]|nr:MAG: hypothetical protein CVU39_11215 [Chloroflexi bacterium HGW-Chloroflexi-10]
MQNPGLNLTKFSKEFIKDHNQEAKEVWEAFRLGKPIRPPVRLGTTTQFFIFNEFLNPDERITFSDYLSEAKTMLDFSLKSALWRIENIAQYCDDLIDLPDEFSIRVDLQTFEEAAYFGAPLEFLSHQVPDTRPILSGNKKYMLFDQPYPDPMVAGYYGKARQIYEEMLDYLQKHPTFLDRPVTIQPYGYWTGGFLTLAMALRGFEFLTDLVDDTDYAFQLLKYLYDGIVSRVKIYSNFFSLPFPNSDLFFVDDSIQLISTKMLKEYLLPLYKQYKSEITTAEHIKMHLCGDASRHFKILKDELGVNEFETGFPIDFGKVRRELGPDVTIQGGPNIMFLKDGSPEEVSKETQRILESGILDGGKFILREGNNLAPHTPFNNLDSMFQTARKIRF